MSCQQKSGWQALVDRDERRRGWQRGVVAPALGMDSTDLHPDQVERLGGQMRKMLRYLNRLCDGMIRLGFPVDDPLQLAAVRARAAMGWLEADAGRIPRYPI